jgi:signal peptidase I
MSVPGEPTALASVPPSPAPPPPPEKPKSRLVAALLGLVAPGLGQAFVGHALRGVLWAALPFVLCAIFVVFAREPSTWTVLAALSGSAMLGYLGAIVDVAAMPAAKHRPASLGAVIAVAVAPILLGPVVAVGLRALVVEAFKVPSGAMIPTIAVGDHLFVDKAVYRRRLPRRGEVFVFQFPERPAQDFVKRAIAVAGDTLEVRRGHPIINGWEVPSCSVGRYRYTDGDEGTTHEGELFVEFLEAAAYLVLFDSAALSVDYQGPYRAQSGETWVMGDNRNNSHDSRVWFGGAGGGVPASHVKGRARLIWLSPSASHQGTDLAADPVAPSPELAAPLAKCLANRPAAANATPPPPR